MGLGAMRKPNHTFFYLKSLILLYCLMAKEKIFICYGLFVINNDTKAFSMSKIFCLSQIRE